MKEFVKKNGFEWLFLLLQCSLYAAFLALDLFGDGYRPSVCIKYTMIILCFCYAFLTGGACKSLFYTDTSFLQMGLFFTLISDLLILILDYYFYGVLVFILVQQLYGLHLALLHYQKKSRVMGFSLYRRRLILQIGLAVLLCLLLHIAGLNMDGLLVASVCYFIGILFNTVSAAYLAGKDYRIRSRLFLAAGMLLFLLCDINVGLFNLSGFIELPEEIYSGIYSCSSILMWAFYAPSQVLLALSVAHSLKENVRQK